jgi:hypothetical protein
MGWENHFNELIDAAWRVINTDFDEHEFQVWREKALECVTFLVGPEHEHTLRLKRRASRQNPVSVQGTFRAWRNEV